MLDPAAQDYRVAAGEVAPEVAELLKIRAPAEKFAKLRASAHPQAQFLWAIFRDLFHYSAYHLADVADNARDVDLAIRWGFGWQMGPFETWQAAGWRDVARWVAEDIAAGKTLGRAPLPGVGHRRQGRRGARRAYGAGRLFRGAATRSCRARRCPSTGASSFPIRCWASAPTPARRSSRPMRCACGTWATTSASCRSRARRTRSAEACSTALNRAIDEAERNSPAS